MIEGGMTVTAAQVAALGPGLAAAAAIGAGDAHRHGERNDQTVLRLALRQRHFGAQHARLALVAEKRFAHALDYASYRRKVDRDLVCKALVQHEINDPLTIGGGPCLVNAPHGCYREQESCLQ